MKANVSYVRNPLRRGEWLLRVEAGSRDLLPAEGAEVLAKVADGTYKRERIGQTVRLDARRGLLFARIVGDDQNGPVQVVRIGARQ